MTDKVTLTALANLQNDTTATTAINANSVAITTAMDNTLSRDGTSPNNMNANIDMNSNHILNLPNPSTATEPLRFIDLANFLAGSFNPAGNLTITGLSVNPTIYSSLNVPFPSDPVNALIRVQHGTVANPIDITNTSSNAITSQFNFKTTNSTYTIGTCLNIESHSQAGTNTAALGLSILSVSEGSTVQSGATGGANGFISIGKSLVGGDVFGGNTYAWAQTTAPRSVIGFEADVDNRISGNTSECGIQIVKVATSIAVVSGGVSASNAINIVNQTGSANWRDNAIQIGTASGSPFPLGSGANLLTVYTGTINTGFDLSRVTFSSGRWCLTLNNAALSSYNAAGAVIKNLIKLNTSDNLSLYDDKILIDGAGKTTVNQNVSATPSIASAASGLIISLIDAGAGGHQAYSYAAQANNVVARANGTGASPTKVINTNNIGSYFFGGYHGGNLWVTNTAGIQGVAVEDWNDSTHLGVSLKILTTPAATGTNAEAGRFNSSGGLSIGTTTDAGIGAILANTSIRSQGATAGIGYATGAGGTVTQGTNRTTGVTLNTITGAITLFSAAGSATPASFTVTNSAVAATDIIVVNQKSGTDLYEIFVTAVAAGSFKITSFTTGGTTTEQPVFNFAVIKGVTS